MTMLARTITGGVDTHLDVHVAAALDDRGLLLGVESFPTTTAGYRQLLGWLGDFGTIDLVGVEGTGSYGAGLTRHLHSEGVRVVEIDRPNRQRRRRRGKSDPEDAVAAARAAQAGESKGEAKTRDGNVEAMRVMRVARHSARKARTQALNQMRSLISTAPEVVRDELRDLNVFHLLERASAYRPGVKSDLVSVTKRTLRMLARRAIALEEEVKEIDATLRELVRETAPELVTRLGVGTEAASALLVAAGDNPERLRSEATFAHLCGASPLDASSGKHERHRLNRGGDRQANSALWHIVLTRMVYDPRTGPTYKGGWGFHPLLVFADGTGECLSGMLRPGNAGANAVADHVVVLDEAIAQLPPEIAVGHRVGDDPSLASREVTIRSDSAGCSEGFLAACRARGVGFSVVARRNAQVEAAIFDAIGLEELWQPALRQDGELREGAAVIELTSLVDLSHYPSGTRLIVRREPLHPGAQQTLFPAIDFRYWGHYTDQDGDPVTLDAYMRAHAHVEEHIARLKDSGLCRFPFSNLEANRTWLFVVAAAADLVRWFQLLCLDGALAAARPKTLRWSFFHAPGRLVRSARREIVRVLDGWPEADALLSAYRRIALIT